MNPRLDPCPIQIPRLDPDSYPPTGSLCSDSFPSPSLLGPISPPQNPEKIKSGAPAMLQLLHTTFPGRRGGWGAGDSFPMGHRSTSLKRRSSLTQKAGSAPGAVWSNSEGSDEGQVRGTFMICLPRQKRLAIPGPSR